MKKFTANILIILMVAFSSCSMPVYSPDNQEPILSNVSDQDITYIPLATDNQDMIEEMPSEDQVENTTVSSQLLFEIMDNNRDKFAKILDDPECYEVQILLTEITRNQAGQPSFVSYAYEVDSKKYFYPASTVKMAIAALALQKINSLPDADRSCVLNVAKSKNGTIGRSGFTVETYIKRMMIYSDNIAYNRLYDFLGQEYINETLHSMGYQDTHIIRRLNSPTTAATDRENFPYELRAGDGTLIHSQPALINENNIYTLRDRDDMSGLLRGKMSMTSRGKVAEPMEFYDYNYMSMEVMQQILKSLIFPLNVEQNARFDISEDDREFLLACMRGEDTSHKYFIYGGMGQPNPNMEIYNKTGTGYGNILDNAYIVEKTNNIEFMLTAVIYVNPNDTMADDTYDYEKTGMPFLKELGLAVYNYYVERSDIAQQEGSRI